MKKVSVVVIGFGDRGDIYAKYALSEPDKMQVVAVVDPSKDRLNLAKKKHSLKDEQLFENVDDFVKSGIRADLIINATMDQQHYEVLKKTLSLSKYYLTEKPIVNNKKDLLVLESIAEKCGTTVFVGHVLRYTPFYRTIKKLLNDGKIGQIVTMELSEHVSSALYSGSYCRGRWRSEAESGSTFLLAKSCHDADLLCWLNDSTKPVSVSSFGGRYQFIPANAPKNATKFCYQCPHKDTCIYSATNMYGENDLSAEITHPKYHKEKITLKDRMEFIKSDIFGQCIYTIKGNDLVDRQSIIVNYENGSTATFILSSGATIGNRTVFIMGTKGEIEGDLASGKIILRENIHPETERKITTIDASKEITSDKSIQGHSGGDYEISKAIVNYINGDRSSISLTKFSDSINGHLLVFAADKARIKKQVVDIK